MSEQSSKANLQSEEKLKRDLGFKDVLGIAIGQTIGSGVMAMTGIAIGMTGRGVVLAYVLSSIFVVFMSFPTMMNGSALPSTGGSYRYASRLLHPAAGLFYLLIYIAYNITLSLFAISFADYMQSILPGIPFKLTAICLLVVLYIFNLFGIKWMARVQNLMVVVMGISFAVFIIYGIPQVDFASFTGPNIMPNGFVTLITTAGLLTFATGGANVVTNLGGEMKNPGRDIPVAMVLGTLLVGILYAFLALVASGVLPIEQVAYQNLSNVASTILPKPLFIFFIVGGAMFAIATTLNSTLSWVTKPLLAACKDGWLPARLGTVHKKYGTPYYLLTIFLVIGLIPVILDIPLSSIATIGSGISLFMALIPMFATYFLHKKYPEAVAKAPFRLKPGIAKVSITVALILCFIQSVLLFSTLGMKAMIASMIYAVVALVFSIVVTRIKKPNFYTGDAEKDFG